MEPQGCPHVLSQNSGWRSEVCPQILFGVIINKSLNSPSIST